MVVFFVLSLKGPLFIESQYQKRVFSFQFFLLILVVISLKSLKICVFVPCVILKNPFWLWYRSFHYIEPLLTLHPRLLVLSFDVFRIT